mmetsp:Transcript_37609/g.67390  ORF Transcript_37609/g.67390 Transcript_37609/m.67390 type:complete len:248 (-) Transcript_37609:544-1287(-)
MFAVFNSRTLDPPFLVAPMTDDKDENTAFSGEELGHHLKAYLDTKAKGLKNSILTCTGGAFAASEDTPFGEKDGLAIFATGDITNTAEISELYNINPAPDNVVDLLRALYDADFTDIYGDCSDQPATAISSFEGDFSIMVYDSNCGYFLAARSSCGTHPLYWGTEEGNEEVAIVSTKKDGLADFPPGCLFESNGEGTGELANYMRHTPARRAVNAFPRKDSHGHLCAVKYTTQSGTDLVSMAGAPMA